MPENLYPQLPTAPSMSQESFNIEMVRKYFQDIANPYASKFLIIFLLANMKDS